MDGLDDINDDDLDGLDEDKSEEKIKEDDDTPGLKEDEKEVEDDDDDVNIDDIEDLFKN